MWAHTPQIQTRGSYCLWFEQRKLALGKNTKSNNLNFFGENLGSYQRVLHQHAAYHITRHPERRLFNFHFHTVYFGAKIFKNKL